MLLVLFMDETFYILNLFVQTIGYYFQNLIQIGTHTEAYEQLGPSAHKGKTYWRLNRGHRDFKIKIIFVGQVEPN